MREIKVSKFQNEFTKSSFLPKYEPLKYESKKLKILKKSPCNFVCFVPLIPLLFANKSTFIIQINFYICQERKVFSALKSQ